MVHGPEEEKVHRNNSELIRELQSRQEVAPGLEKLSACCVLLDILLRNGPWVPGSGDLVSGLCKPS